MNAAIGPGDWVECVNATPCLGCRRPVELVQCAVYRVTALAPTDADGCAGLFLYEAEPCARCSGGVYGFDLRRFRPIYRPKSSIIQGLLSDIPASVPA